MKRLIGYSPAATVALLIVVLANAGMALADTPIKIMPLGDSITRGQLDGGGSNFVPGGYRDKLYRDLTSAGMSFSFVGTATDNPSTTLTAAGQTRHSGYGGWRIDQIDSNLTSGLGFMNQNPDVILLQIGTNDYFQSPELTVGGTIKFGANDLGTNGQVLPGPDAKDRLDTLITHITTAKPQAKLIVASLTPLSWDTGNSALSSGFDQYLPGIVTNHKALGQQVYFLDLNQAIWNGLPSDWRTNSAHQMYPWFLNDGAHFNQRGYDLIGDTWAAAVQSAVPEPGVLSLFGLCSLLLLPRRR